MIHSNYLNLLNIPAELLSMLGLQITRPLELAEIPTCIDALLYAEPLGLTVCETLERFLGSPGFLRAARSGDPRLAAFADYLAFADIVPFEESPLKLSSFSSVGRKSLNLLGNVSMIQSGVSSAAVLFPLLLGPHAPVVFAVAGAGIGGMATVDGIGVVVGAADSPKAQQMFGNVRKGLNRLTHRRKQGSNKPDSYGYQPDVCVVACDLLTAVRCPRRLPPLAPGVRWSPTPAAAVPWVRPARMSTVRSSAASGAASSSTSCSSLARRSNS
jgi:hypothetical protein